MAERRMFTKKITDGDMFTSMPPTAQCLYFHLCMTADDDGFSNQVRQSMFNAHAGTDDFNTLVQKRFIIPFDSGVIVIKHWRMHNWVRSDRYHETKFVEEKSALILKDNGVYSFPSNDTKSIGMTSDIPTAYQPHTEDSIGKDSIGKDNNTYGDLPSDKSADYEQMFSILWKQYPKKRGKGQVSDKAKRKLLSIGLEQMTRCIDRYKAEIKGKDDQYVMYGSTFFNSGYVDYLDENYEKPKSNPGFNIDDWGKDE